MKLPWKKFLRPALFVLVGAAAGWLYYRFVGCTGSCAIASSPLRSMLYMGIVGWLVSGIFPTRKED